MSSSTKAFVVLVLLVITILGFGICLESFGLMFMSILILGAGIFGICEMDDRRGQ